MIKSKLKINIKKKLKENTSIKINKTINMHKKATRK